jgi:hypothetical protein
MPTPKIADWKKTFSPGAAPRCPLCREQIALHMEDRPTLIQSDGLLYLAHVECGEEYAAGHNLEEVEPLLSPH